MRDFEREEATVKRLLDNTSLEATVKQIRARPDLLGYLPRGMSVYVPVLPGQKPEESIEPVKKLKESGLNPIPHVTARTQSSISALRDVLSAYVEAGARSVLMLSGDAKTSAGPFSSTLDVIESGVLSEVGLSGVGFAGHPEGHPMIDDATLSDAIRVKSEFARSTGTKVWLVTQFVFRASAAIAWEKRLLDSDARLRIQVGVPGPSKLTTLIKYAIPCGVAASAKFLASRRDALQLLGRWQPDEPFDDLVRHISSTPRTLIDGVHFFTFGSVSSTLDWLNGRNRSATLEQLKARSGAMALPEPA